MSFIIRGNILKNTCHFGLNKLTNAPKIYQNIAIKALQTRFYSDDNEKNKLETIYTGKLTNNVKHIKFFSLTTSTVGLLLQPYLLPKIMESGSTASTVMAAVMFGFFTICTPMLLHVITRKYVTDIKHDPITNTYTATTYSIFIRPKVIEFTPADVEQCGLGQMMTTCFVKGKPIFIDAESFTDVKYFANIMGYDKPMNFEAIIKKTQDVNPPKPKIN
ncbi:hypothetical protein HCN44_011103 [Aphidius gifuensis]|uniref:Transmembrane protein 70 homolog, mitochondrial n=1 Tax=Aphidius gifuensis TaxID=684658 RepID=A0A834XZ48_APHGI|nr:transmembrane protein 70 homolog, mitochondrial [Aphidius gifuensis]KAF7993834.1 hypothetical protein HCN44_011103 [Aphidius gifuensis]